MPPSRLLKKTRIITGIRCTPATLIGNKELAFVLSVLIRLYPWPGCLFQHPANGLSHFLHFSLRVGQVGNRPRRAPQKWATA